MLVPPELATRSWSPLLSTVRPQGSDPTPMAEPEGFRIQAENLYPVPTHIGEEQIPPESVHSGVHDSAAGGKLNRSPRRNDTIEGETGSVLRPRSGHRRQSHREGTRGQSPATAAAQLPSASMAQPVTSKVNVSGRFRSS